jgi:acetoin utilization protein AcuB
MNIVLLMGKSPIAVAMDDTLATVRDIFEKHKFHHVLVVENQRLVGIVSDRDLLKSVSPNLGKLSESARDLATLNKRVHQIMTRDPIVLRADAELRDAVRLFGSHRISCIPVVDQDDRPIGIVSWRDVLKAVPPDVL